MHGSLLRFASIGAALFIAGALLAGCASGGGSPAVPAGSTQLGEARWAFDGVKPESIVYTPVNETLTNTGKLKLDLNNDGTNDFTFHQSYFPIYMSGGMGPPQLCGAEGGTGVTHQRGGVANGAQSGWAAVLAYGIPIDSSVRFDRRTGSVMSDFATGCVRHPYDNGYWNGASDMYLGLVFKVGGQAHYGWAQMSVSGGEHGITTTLTGYAYETVAGKSILAGQTK